MEDLGRALRAARVARKLSLRAVATAAEVSPSLLSQVETGKTLPSVGTLYALVNVLEVSIDDLLGMPDRLGSTVETDDLPSRAVTAAPVQRAEDNPTINMENGVRWERLAVEGAGLVDALLTTYEPGSSSSVEGKLMRHSGIEYGYIISGEVTLRLDFDEYVLRAGDSTCFDSSRPHLYENRSSSTSQGLWFVLGRSRTASDSASEHQLMNSAVDVLSALGRLPVADHRKPGAQLP